MKVLKYWLFKNRNKVKIIELFNFILIDLEGYDYEALLDAVNLIIKNKPKIAVTTYHKSQHTEEINAYLI